MPVGACADHIFRFKLVALGLLLCFFAVPFCAAGCDTVDSPGSLIRGEEFRFCRRVGNNEEGADAYDDCDDAFNDELMKVNVRSACSSHDVGE